MLLTCIKRVLVLKTKFLSFLRVAVLHWFDLNILLLCIYHIILYPKWCYTLLYTGIAFENFLSIIQEIFHTLLSPSYVL